jgi:pimeloyl-ACP methyl ester carboxylesterase
MKAHPLFLLSLMLFPASAGRATQPVAPRLALGACTDPALPEGARCSTYEVFENRAAGKGRKIPLRVVVLPALGPDRQPDAVVIFSGGPGESSVEWGTALAGGALAPLRRHRDFLLVDARGTGGSAPLDCLEMRGAQAAQGALDHFMPVEAVRACGGRLRGKADLTQYTTDNAVDDVDDVRAALGYSKVDVIGASYGTRSVLVYLRRHPDRVRAAILHGVVPTHDRSPLFFARNTQKALDGRIEDCARDAACARAFPHLKEEIEAVLARAGREPVRVELAGSGPGGPSEVRLSRNGVSQTLRYMLYSPSSAAELPLRVHLAAEGSWKPLAETAVSSIQGIGGISQGTFLSVTCAEDVPFIRDSEIPAAVAGTFLGDFRIREQRAACGVWPVAKVSESFLAPVTSDAPVLIVGGERDPATPPADGEEAARHFRQGRFVLVPGAGHNLDGLRGRECVDRLWVKTIEDGSVDRLDTACVARIERLPFATSPPAP